MKKQNGEELQSIMSGIFKIPKKCKATPLLYPEMDEETYALIENLRERVKSSGKQMLIEEIELAETNALLAAQTEQIAIFIQDFDLWRPRFIWLRKSQIRQLFYPNWFVAVYLKQGMLPGQPDFMSGLDWTIQPKNGQFWITCSNPPINGEITYSGLALRFQSMYPEIDKPTPPPCKKHKEESEGTATYDLKPLGFGGIK